jgi:SAM-dependent methyltransferase
MRKIEKCPACGGTDFALRDVLWPELVSDWGLSPSEVEVINRQQGYHCTACGNNLRSMALADAILNAHDFNGTLAQFVESEAATTFRVLEINAAGGLSFLLGRMPGHQRVCYPESDMTKLSFQSGIFDLVVHSDTLEHLPDPVAGLAECRRVLKNTGRCIFTVPIVVGRLTRARAGLKKSFHGNAGESGPDYMVHTEFGADAWCSVAAAGFRSIRMHCLEYPSGLAIDAALTR